MGVIYIKISTSLFPTTLVPDELVRVCYELLMSWESIELAQNGAKNKNE